MLQSGFDQARSRAACKHDPPPPPPPAVCDLFATSKHAPSELLAAVYFGCCALSAGGFLSQAYGWQAPFVALLVFSAGIIIPANLFLVHETHQYKLMKRLEPSIAETVREGPGILARPPKCGSPWAPLVSVCDKRVILHLMQASMGFACMMSTQAEISRVLASEPYYLSPGMIGVAFIGVGAMGMIASPLGGRLFDKAGARSPQPMPRLLWNSVASLVGGCVPAG